MNFYQHSKWVNFREEVIRLDGGRCTECGRGRSDGVVLQVHHKHYVKGRKPWEYHHDECETLCKGCHAQEHGIIMPQSGWELVASDDLEDLVGSCEACNTDIRYTYLIQHEKWPAMEVGTVCCDRLTGTSIASDHLKSLIAGNAKIKRFVSSRRWREDPLVGWCIKQSGFSVCIAQNEGKFRISINGISGNKQFESLVDAKIRVFSAIDSGQAAKFLSKHAKSHK